MDRPEVYVFDWRKDLTQLREYLDQCGGYYNVSAIFRWSKKEHCYVETNEKTIVICPQRTKIQLESAYPQIFGKQIKDYEWDTFPEPKSVEGETTNLHISGLPNDFLESDAKKYVSEQLSSLVSEGSYKTDFKLRSRTSGEISGYGQIFFEEGTDLYTIKLCKLMLHNKPIRYKNDSKKTLMVRSVWFKPAPTINRVNGDRENKKSETGITHKTIRIRPVSKVDVSTVGILPAVAKLN